MVSKDFLGLLLTEYSVVKMLPLVQCNELSQGRGTMFNSEKEGWGGNPNPHIYQPPVELLSGALLCSAAGEEHSYFVSCQAGSPGVQAPLGSPAPSVCFSAHCSCYGFSEVHGETQAKQDQVEFTARKFVTV